MKTSLHLGFRKQGYGLQRFSLAKVRDSFGLTLDESQDLFARVSHIEPSETLKILLADYVPLAVAIATETSSMARSHYGHELEVSYPIGQNNLSRSRRVLHQSTRQNFRDFDDSFKQALVDQL